MPRRLPRILIGALLAALAVSAASLSIDNPAGDIEVVIAPGSRLAIDGRAEAGFEPSRDLDIVRNGNDFRIRVRPREGSLHLMVRLPLGSSFEGSTTSGDISIEGMAHLVRLETDTGAVRLKVPLRGTRITLDANTAPPEFSNPDPKAFRVSTIELAGDRKLWRLRDRLPEEATAYGDYRVITQQPRAVEIEEFERPVGWPLRFHWEATEELAKMVGDTDQPALQPAGESSAHPRADEGLLFRSDVRMVSLTLAVNDSEGRPASGLSDVDFRVYEGGVEQRVSAVQAGDAAFNLVVLLDMSGSARLDIGPMRAAAKRFIEMARPGDRVALYALSQGMMQVVAPLTSNRETLAAAVDDLPPIAGGSPVYDVITLAYAQELRQLKGERNALIVISDGLDNQVTGQETPSSVRFRGLKRAAEGMEAILYPVFLLSGQRFGRSWSKRAQRRMEELARATGGLLFPAESISDLEPVFPQIESELRSVYSLGYYPNNQDFDGGWRSVEVSAPPGYSVRTRPGYYAN